MNYGSIPGLDKHVSRLVQGTLALNPAEQAAGFDLLDAVFEMGCTCFDTAHVYGAEREKGLGLWIRERGIREKVVILAKGAHHNDVRPRVTPFDIAADLHDTLARLKTDYVDLYVLHRDDPSVPVGPIVESLNEWVRAGKVRAFGGSNWTHERIQEANEYAESHGLTGFALSSPNFSFADLLKPPWPGCTTISGPANATARDWYTRTQLPVFAWSSLAAGFFSGLITRDNVGELTDSQHKLAAECYASEDNFRRLDRATELAQRIGCTAAQIALAWLMHQSLNLFAVVGCRTRDEFKQNVDALDLPLSPEELSHLTRR
jgi:aryl-alcohol dehydrogenase-like predicted oxidoreductase